MSRGQPSPPTEHHSVLHTSQNSRLVCVGCMYLWFRQSHLSIHANGSKTTEWCRSSSKSVDNSHSVRTLSDSRLSFPSHCCYSNTHIHTHTHLTKPQEADANCASPPAEQRQLSQSHCSRTSLPVLATMPVSVPVQGLAHRFQSLELDKPQISKKPSVIKASSLLRLHFSTSHGICRHLCSSEQRAWGSCPQGSLRPGPEGKSYQL